MKIQRNIKQQTNLGEYSVDSQCVGALRLPLAVMVICIHSYIPNDANYLIILLSHVLSHIAVPLFFMFSGYYFFTNLQNWDWSVWIAKMFKRCKSLLLPYIVWISLFVVYCLIFGFVKGLVTGNQFSLIDWFSENGGFHMFWDSYKWNIDSVDLWGHVATSSAPILVPFWFMRDLIVVVVFTPILHSLLRTRDTFIGRYLPLVSLLILGTLYFTSTFLIVPGLSSQTFFYFGLGAYFQLQKKSMVDSASDKGKLLLITAFALLVIDTIFDGHNTNVGQYVYKPWVFTGVFSALCIAKFIIVKAPFVSDRLQKWSECTFFLFAIHAFLIPYVKMPMNFAIGKIFNETNIYTEWFSSLHVIIYTGIYLSIIVLTTLLSILMYMICQKYMPKTCKILTGR